MLGVVPEVTDAVVTPPAKNLPASQPRAAGGRSPARIWAVGGGKGGVGKSVVSSNLAVSLAGRGLEVVVVDADLGGANLHTVLGVQNPSSGVSAFLRREVERLEEALVDTPVPGLRLLTDGHRDLELANIKYAHKTRLLRHLRRLPADLILLDLGAGTSFNVLDFFLTGHVGAVVVTPEPTSVENAYHFLKASFYRALSRAARKARVRETLGRVLDDRMRLGLHSPRRLLAHLETIDTDVAAVLAGTVANFRVGLVVNQARKEAHHRLGEEMAVACRDYFGAAVSHVATMPRDDRVLDALEARRPVWLSAPDSPFALAIAALTDRLLEVSAEDRAHG